MSTNDIPVTECPTCEGNGFVKAKDFTGIRWYYDMDYQGFRFVRGDTCFLFRDSLVSGPYGEQPFLYQRSILDLYSDPKSLSIEDLIDDSLISCRVTAPRYPWEQKGNFSRAQELLLRGKYAHGLRVCWFETNDAHAHRAFDCLKEEIDAWSSWHPRVCIDGPTEGDVINCITSHMRVFSFDGRGEKHIYEVGPSTDSLKFVRTEICSPVR